MRKRLTAATLAALMALSMTACSGGKAAETTAAPETKVEEHVCNRVCGFCCNTVT